MPLPLSFTDRCIAVIGSYLLLEKGHWIFVDLKAAHARILYESLQEEKGHSQTLMLPLEIHLADADDEILEGLQKIGVEAHLLGRKTLCIDALPSSLEAADFPQFFENWREGKKLGIRTDHPRLDRLFLAPFYSEQR